METQVVLACFRLVVVLLLQKAACFRKVNGSISPESHPCIGWDGWPNDALCPYPRENYGINRTLPSVLYLFWWVFYTCSFWGRRDVSRTFPSVLREPRDWSEHLLVPGVKAVGLIASFQFPCFFCGLGQLGGMAVPQGCAALLAVWQAKSAMWKFIFCPIHTHR